MSVPYMLGLSLLVGGGLICTRHWGRSPWRWLVWPQAALMLLVSLLAYQGRLPAQLARWPLADKALHFLLFGSVVVWLTLWLGARSWRVGGLALPLALLVPLAIATADELAQGFSAHRSMDLADWLCDLGGMLFFWWLSRHWGASAAGRHNDQAEVGRDPNAQPG